MLAERRIARERRQAEFQNRQDAARNNVMNYVNNEEPQPEESQDQPPNEPNLPLESRDRIIENLSPGWSIPIIVESDNRRNVIPMVWGLIPNYEDISQKPNHFKLFNKRIETLSSKGYFRKLVETRRCVVVLDGFYEWKKVNGVKNPYYVSIKDRPLLCAGIYEYSKKLNENNEVITFPTFSMITGEPSKKFSSVHNREPALLTEDQMKLWLDSRSDVDMLIQLLVDCAKREESETYGSIEYHQVTSKMSVTKYQEADCSLPLSKSEILAAATAPTVKKEKTNVKKESTDIKTEEEETSHSLPTSPVKGSSSGTGKRSAPSTPSESNKLTKYFKSVPKSPPPASASDVVDLT